MYCSFPLCTPLQSCSLLFGSDAVGVLPAKRAFQHHMHAFVFAVGAFAWLHAVWQELISSDTAPPAAGNEF
jgi:hypothetical protein